MKFSYQDGTSNYQVLSLIFGFQLGYYFLFSLFSLVRLKLSFWSKAFLEFLFCILPIVLVLNNPFTSYYLNTIYLVLSLVMNMCSKSIDLHSSSTDQTPLHDPQKKPRNPVISLYRTTLLVLTMFAILACDFSTFPGYLMKTHTYGYSLMDVGIGTFVFTAGLVSGSSIRRRRKDLFLPRMLFVLKKQLPMLVIGIARYLLAKAFHYGYDITEYGTFWNFFFTYVSIHVIAELLDLIIRDAMGVGVFVITIYQIFLNNGVSDYIFNAERTDFFSSNREGIISLIGYIAMFITARDYGNLLKQKKTSIKLFFVSFVFSAAYIVYCVVLEFGVSRRLVSLGYFLWICALNMVGIWLFHLLKLVFKYESKDIALSECINYYGLTLFLLANLLTFFVRYTLKPRDFSHVPAYSIQVGYMSIIIIVSIFLSRKKLFGNNNTL